jgi:hypothetical protein
MKKILLLLLVVLNCCTLHAQQADTPAFRKYPSMPAVMVLRPDSSGTFNTFDWPEGQPTLILFFDPGCDHCDRDADSLIHYLPRLTHTRILMASNRSLAAIRAFAARKKLNDHPQIRLGKDLYNLIPGFFKVQYLPFFAVYDSRKKLVDVWDGGARWNELLRALER